MYPLFMMFLGGSCFIISVEFVFHYLNFLNPLYIGDTLILLGASVILIGEGWLHFFKIYCDLP